VIRQIITQPVRVDAAGDGNYGAPRGSRAHTGVDYVCVPGAPVLSPVSGVMEAPSIAYAYDHSYKICNIRGDDGFRYRLFYVEKILSAGARVSVDTAVATAMDVTMRYPNSKAMKPHIHVEIRDENNDHVNPETLKLTR
jgi:murein DD-endopeptidase MepM/ murein hydrolase activator NlpD